MADRNLLLNAINAYVHFVLMSKYYYFDLVKKNQILLIKFLDIIQAILNLS